MSQTLIHKPPQAVTKLGMRCKYEYSSSLTHTTESKKGEKYMETKKKYNHKVFTNFTLIERLVWIPVSEIIILNRKEKK